MMEKPSPPPYSSDGHQPPAQGDDIEGNALLNHLIDRANTCLDPPYPSGAQDILDRETERVRNMLKFTLSVDYKYDAGTSISAVDREHFIYMADAFRLIKDIKNDMPRLQKPDRMTPGVQTIIAYFTKYLHEPCKALQVPLDCVHASIAFLSRYTDRNGNYKGSLMGHLNDYGLDALATKLYMDRTVLIPRVFSDPATQEAMLDSVIDHERKAFKNIFGLESSTTIDPQGKFRTLHSVTYEANEQQIRMVSEHNVMARVCQDLSIQHWTKALGEALAPVAAKLKLSRDGERAADYSWKSWWQRYQLPWSRKLQDIDVVAEGWQSGL